MHFHLSHLRTPVKRERAEEYIFLTLLSFGISVVGTRLFLELTGYPQIGNSELHIAHVLWGGLALFIGTLLPLIFVNRWALSISAILGGVGVGLFIDEVGKFITQSNDYFYPLAAPIIYAFFLLTVLLYLQVRRRTNYTPRAEMYHVFDGMMEVLDNDLNMSEHADLQESLVRISTQDDNPHLGDLARSLLSFLDSESIRVIPDKAPWWQPYYDRVLQFENKWLHQSALRKVFIGLFFIFGISAIIELVGMIILTNFPEYLEQVIFQVFLVEEQVEGLNELNWFLVRLLLGMLIGMVFLFATYSFIKGDDNQATRLGIWGFLLSLTMLNLLVFYFDQFTTITSTLLDFVILLGIVRYRQRFILEEASAQQIIYSQEPPSNF